jgi:hypothetical protein
VANSLPACLIPLDPAVGKIHPLAVTSLAARDAQVLFVGGSRPSLGNLESLQFLNQFLRQLPTSESILYESSSPKAPTIRMIKRNNQTFVMAFNETFWSQDIRLEFSSSSNGTPIANVRDPSLSDVRRSSSGWEWRVRLDAKDMAVIRIPSSDLTILSAEQSWSESLADQLSETVTGLVRSIGALHDPLPLAVPINASFEKTTGDEIADWEANHVAGVTVAQDESQYHEGGASARIESTGPSAWIRSRPFAIPQTGRISLKIWLRVDPSTSAPIRLACEGILDGQPYYRFAQIDPAQLQGTPDTWTPFVLVIDDLPATGMRDLRTRVDLLGQGKIWIDAIQAFDLSFLPEELTELSEIAAVADLQFRDGDYTSCHRTLNSYWVQMMLDHAPPAEIRIAKAEPSKNVAEEKRPPQTNNTHPEAPPATPRLVDRVRRWIPLPLPVRPKR